MFKKIFATVLVIIMAFGFSGCGEKYKLPEYSQKEFEISAFWAPYDISEEGLQQYKNAGFNTLAMINHSLDWTSENQFYLGSKRTMTALENCKKVGLDAILNYNDWVAMSIEGEDYYGETPFSKYDIYGEYKDIIRGVHICDEPTKNHIYEYNNKTFIEDFKKVYPNADYVINLIPFTAVDEKRGYTTYDEMMTLYGEEIMSQFDNPYISVDVYPFHLQINNNPANIAGNYEIIAKKAKEYGGETTFILQSSTGNEFEAELSEGDMRWEVNSALAFGADNLQYYCYAVPIDESRPNNAMYDYCITNPDGTPSPIYDYVKTVNKEAQSIAPIILSYDWDKAFGILGEKSSDFRVSAVTFNDLSDSKHYVEGHATHDLVISRFTSDDYGEAYMLVNFADNATNKIDVTFKDCRAVAVYGGKGYTGTPEIVELDENGKFTRELSYGEGVFVTPIV